MKYLWGFFLLFILLKIVCGNTLKANDSNGTDNSEYYNNLLENSQDDPQMRAEMNYMECLREALELNKNDFYSKLITELSDFTKETAVNQIDLFCPKIQQLDKCIEVYYEELILVHPDEKKLLFLKSMIPIFEHIVLHGCANDGAIIREFIVDDGIECIQNSIEKIRSCFINMKLNYSGNIEKAFILKRFSNDDCMAINTLKTCTDGVFKKNCKNTVRGTINMITNEIIGIIKCNSNYSTNDEISNDI